MRDGRVSSREPSLTSATPRLSSKPGASPVPRRYSALTGGSSAGSIDVYALHQRLADLGPRLHEGIKGPLRKQKKDFAVIDLSDLEKAQQELHEARVRADAAAESAIVKMPDDDPDLPRVRKLEADLNWYMTQAIRLHHLSRAYRSEADQWREKAQGLLIEKRDLAAKTSHARRQNALMEAATERLDPACDDLGAPLLGRHQDLGRGCSSVASGGVGSSRPPSQPAELERTRSAPQPASARSSSSSAGGGRELHATSRSPWSARGVEGIGSAQARDGAFGEQRYLREIANLEGKLRRVRHEVNHLRTAQGSAARLACGHKDDMEEFFLLCMHDLKQEVRHQKDRAAASRHASRGRRKTAPAAKPATHKEKVLALVLGSDDLLALLYEKLFPHRRAGFRSIAWDGNTSRIFESSCTSSVAAAEPSSIEDHMR
mmetsp:Transcript_125270/g.348547  ORF Transcript_125270/g.348547 Transcript_125270/m.348547 type:complete len:431 (-) Transcript_125270:18-1310(-)